MISASQLNSNGEMAADSKNLSENCHIYLICQHPAASYIKESFSYKDGYISGSTMYRINGEAKIVNFNTRFTLLDGAVEVRLSPYPHREIHSINASGEIVRYLPASIICFSPESQEQDANIGKFEVLYVGQAYAEGRRSAFERLKSHSTLQKILAENQYNSPDNETFLFTFEYAPYRFITQMDGRAKNAIKDERDSDRFTSILENPLTEHQQICLTEAALIRYFSPKYNEIYKESFPSPSHKILQQCYELDFSGLIVEINTDELGFFLYSQKSAASTHHICQIDLWAHEDRAGFFHYSDGEGGFLKMPDVIK